MSHKKISADNASRELDRRKNVNHIPVCTQRCYNVHKITSGRRRLNVKTAIRYM